LQCLLVAQRQRGLERLAKPQEQRGVSDSAPGPPYDPRGIIFELAFGAINYRIAILGPRAAFSMG
jgi:hypothetical protein